MEKRYRVLRFVGTIAKLVGIIILILTVLGALGACAGVLAGGAAFRDTAAQTGLPLAGGIIGASLLWPAAQSSAEIVTAMPR